MPHTPQGMSTNIIQTTDTTDDTFEGGLDINDTNGNSLGAEIKARLDEGPVLVAIVSRDGTGMVIGPDTEDMRQMLLDLADSVS